jgi:hypothetical protein
MQGFASTDPLEAVMDAALPPIPRILNAHTSYFTQAALRVLFH